MHVKVSAREGGWLGCTPRLRGWAVKVLGEGSVADNLPRPPSVAEGMSRAEGTIRTMSGAVGRWAQAHRPHDQHVSVGRVGRRPAGLLQGCVVNCTRPIRIRGIHPSGQTPTPIE
jgi:hypothetical protein